MNSYPLSHTLARALCLLLSAGLALSLAPAAHAATFTVDTRGDAVDANPGDGLCATVEGRCTLRAAIQETNALAGADTITLPAGNYTLTIPGNGENAAATGDLDIVDDLMLLGESAAATVINGNSAITNDRVLHVAPRIQVGIASVTITGGGAIEEGGGIHNTGGLRLRHSRLVGNTALTGGGIYNATVRIAAELIVENSLIARNRALGEELVGNGGGIYNAPAGRVTVSNSRLANNRASYSGGGMFNAGEVTVSYSTLAGNSASYSGGGIRSLGGTLTVSHSTLATNSAPAGGGIDFYLGTLTVSHSTLSGNFANAGAAIVISSFSTVAVSHSTLTGNSADFEGGGIYISSTDTPVTLESTILAGNVAPSGPDCDGGALGSAGYNLLGNNSGCEFIAAEGDLIGTADDPIDPLLGPLQDNGGPTFTHALLEGSLAIDAGDPDECPPQDQRGYPRPIDGDGNGSAICDIGSYEYGSAP